MPAYKISANIASLAPEQRHNLFTHLLFDETALEQIEENEAAISSFTLQAWQSAPESPHDHSVSTGLSLLKKTDPEVFMEGAEEIAGYYLCKILRIEKISAADQLDALQRLQEEKTQTHDLPKAVRDDVEELHEILLAPQTLNIEASDLIKTFTTTVRQKIQAVIEFQLPHQPWLNILWELREAVNSAAWNEKGLGLLFKRKVPDGIQNLRVILEDCPDELQTAQDVKKFLKLRDKVRRIISKKSGFGLCRDEKVKLFYKDYAEKIRNISAPETNHTTSGSMSMRRLF